LLPRIRQIVELHPLAVDPGVDWAEAIEAGDGHRTGMNRPIILAIRQEEAAGERHPRELSLQTCGAAGFSAFSASAPLDTQQTPENATDKNLAISLFFHF